MPADRPDLAALVAQVRDALEFHPLRRTRNDGLTALSQLEEALRRAEAWRLAVDDAMVNSGLDCTTPESDPAACVKLLTEHAAAIALETSEVAEHAAMYRWLRGQHEGQTEPLQMDADGFPMPQEPTACAFTVFMPDPHGVESLVPVGCIPGELDAAIRAAMECDALKEVTLAHQA